MKTAKPDYAERIDTATRTRKINATIEAPGSIGIDGPRIDENRLTQNAQPGRFAVSPKFDGNSIGIPNRILVKTERTEVYITESVCKSL